MGRTKSKICPDCGSSYANKYAHAEACLGRVRHVKPCEALVFRPSGVKYRCGLPQGHRGAHQ